MITPATLIASTGCTLRDLRAAGHMAGLPNGITQEDQELPLADATALALLHVLLRVGMETEDRYCILKAVWEDIQAWAKTVYAKAPDNTVISLIDQRFVVVNSREQVYNFREMTWGDMPYDFPVTSLSISLIGLAHAYLRNG